MSGLPTVSFARPLEKEPRVGTKYVPGKRHSRYWSEADLDVVRNHYSTKGAAYCKTLLPHRPLGSIYQKAAAMGLSAPDGGPKQRRFRPADLDEQIKEAWPELKGRGAVLALADRLGVHRNVVSDRALKLGLTMPHKKEPPWTKAELELLAKVELSDPKRASKVFHEHGFPRTPASLMVKAKRMGISRRFRGGLSATAVSRILGVDSKTVTREILLGRLKAEKRPTQRLAQQGGDPWLVTRAELRRYILDELAQIDLRKVDKFAFVAVLTETDEPQEEPSPITLTCGRGRCIYAPQDHCDTCPYL